MKLLQSTRLLDIQLRYEKAKGTVAASLSSRGQHRMMLENLTSMLNICVEQHTGGKSGEAYESRRDTKLIFVALKGLKSSPGALDDAHKSLTGGRPLPDLSERTKLSTLDDYVTEAAAERKRIESVAKALTGLSDDVETASDQALQAFSISDSNASA